MASSNKPRPGFRLLAITPPTGDVDAAIVDTWVDAGAHEHGLAVVLREPSISPKSLGDLPDRFKALIERCQSNEVPLLLSTDCQPEDMEGLAGIHLRGDPDVDLVREIREELGAALIGRSCHGSPQHGAELVDYTAVAPVFKPGTPAVHDKKPMGIGALKEWIAPQRRIFALGGISIDTAGACLRAGVHGVAGISAFFGEEDRVRENVAAFSAALSKLGDHALPTQGPR